MSKNHSYFWPTTSSKVFLNRYDKLSILLALIAVLTFSTINKTEAGPQFIDDTTVAMEMPETTDMDEPIFVKEKKIDVVNNSTDPTKEIKANTGFLDAFTSSISAILVTELGDKTFFIAAIMAMRHKRLVVFGGAITALALMTVISVGFGMATTIIPKVYTHYIATALFVIFGLLMIREGCIMIGTDAQEELEEVNSDLHENEQDRDVSSARKKAKKRAALLTTRVIMQAFTMTFLAEWGDRSQLTTITLAASKNVYGVCLGAILGHTICTGLAVIGGRMVAAKISVRMITIIGGIVFICFAAYSLIVGPDES